MSKSRIFGLFFLILVGVCVGLERTNRGCQTVPIVFVWGCAILFRVHSRNCVSETTKNVHTLTTFINWKREKNKENNKIRWNDDNKQWSNSCLDKNGIRVNVWTRWNRTISNYFQSLCVCVCVSGFCRLRRSNTFLTSPSLGFLVEAPTLAM